MEEAVSVERWLVRVNGLTGTLDHLQEQSEAARSDLAATVVKARLAGATWEQIGAAAATSRQTAQKRWGRFVPQQAPLTFDAASPSEWEELADMWKQADFQWRRANQAPEESQLLGGTPSAPDRAPRTGSLLGEMTKLREKIKDLARRVGCDEEALEINADWVAYDGTHLEAPIPLWHRHARVNPPSAEEMDALLLSAGVRGI